MNCRVCDSTTESVLNLGSQYLSDFRADATRPPRFPLELLLCSVCGLVQLGQTVPRELLYTDSYGFRSGVNEAIRDDLASVVRTALAHRPYAKTWLDIASNDGTLLSFVSPDIDRYGIDPVEKFSEESRKHADVIITDFFDRSYFRSEMFDVVTSVSMFYDLDNPAEFVRQVYSVMAPDGVWVIQQNYLLAMVENNAVDNICHEHITYFSLASLEHLLRREGMEVIDVTTSPINGGCIRTVVAKQGVYDVRASVSRQRAVESTAKLDAWQTWGRFADRVMNELRALRAYVRHEFEHGNPSWILGASTRGAVVLQVAGLTSTELPYCVERQAGKVGKFFSPIGSQIIGEGDLVNMPANLVVGPWWHRDLFISRYADYLAGGGRLVFPLPRFEVVQNAGGGVISSHPAIEEGQSL